MKNIKTMKSIICVMTLVVVLGVLSGCSFTVRSNYLYQNGEKYTAGDREITEKIEKIYIDYMSGEIKLLGTSSDGVTIRETSKKQLDDKRRVHTWVDGTTLYVRYCASAKGLELNNLEKRLEITVPEEVELSNLKVEASSADIKCNNVKAGTVSMVASSGDINLKLNGESDWVTIGTSSGEVTAELEKVEKLSVSASSGDISVKADEMKEVETITSSGRQELWLTNAPKTMNVVSSSGDVTLHFPENADLTADFELSSGKLFYDLPFAKNGEQYVCGSGENQMKVHTSSGDIQVKVILE